MAEPKVTHLLIGIVWIGFFSIVIGVFIANMTTNYEVEYTRNLSSFNKLAQLNSSVDQFNQDSNIQEDSSWLDKIGGYFSAGYRALKTVVKSGDIFVSLTNEGFREVNLGVTGGVLKTSIMLTVAIFLIVGVLLRAIFKQML